MRTMILAIALIAPLPVVVPACSPGQALCDRQCDCRHCNDIERGNLCATHEAQREVAEAYECDSEWEELATCNEEHGTCSELYLAFSTQRLDACVDGRCQESMAPCGQDSDCPLGEDLCSGQAERLASCELGATAHPLDPT